MVTFSYSLWRASLEADLLSSLLYLQIPASQPFYSHFLGLLGWTSSRKTASFGLYGAREDNKRQTPKIRVGATQSGLISNEPPSIPTFLHQMSFLPQPSQFILAWDRHRNMLDCILPWLGYLWIPQNKVKSFRTYDNMRVFVFYIVLFGFTTTIPLTTCEIVTLQLDRNACG